LKKKTAIFLISQGISDLTLRLREQDESINTSARSNELLRQQLDDQRRQMDEMKSYEMERQKMHFEEKVRWTK
jgi:hypothetical protein